MARREHTITSDFERSTLTGYRDATMAADEETRDVTWVTRNGNVVAAIIPARNYHDPGECCCKHCPWNGDHSEPGRPGGRVRR